MASEMEALESRYRGYLPSRLSGFYLTNFDYSTFATFKSPSTSPEKRRSSLANSTPSSPFSIPRVSLRFGGSDTSSLGTGTLPRSYSSGTKPDLLPSPYPRRWSFSSFLYFFWLLCDFCDEAVLVCFSKVSREWIEINFFLYEIVRVVDISKLWKLYIEMWMLNIYKLYNNWSKWFKFTLKKKKK